LGAKIGESVTCICKGTFASDNDLSFADEVFSYIGSTESLSENMMNAATAISGSGPAYVFYFVQEFGIDPKNIPNHARHEIMMRFERAAESVGFDRETAANLAANTTNSGLLLLTKTGIDPAVLIDQVASKGGTTEAALKVIKSGGSWDEAALAALKRAEELANTWR
jgi:pyrroline-5-carboxylate reductase